MLHAVSKSSISTMKNANASYVTQDKLLRDAGKTCAWKTPYNSCLIDGASLQDIERNFTTNLNVKPQDAKLNRFCFKPKPDIKRELNSQLQLSNYTN